jgi:glycosyltransferase involved in cell wall biosynthesis
VKVAFVNLPWDEVVPPVEGGSIAIITYQIARRLAGSHDIVIYSKKGHDQPKTQYDEYGIHHRRMSVTAEDWLVKPLKLVDKLPLFRDPRKPLFASRAYYLGYALQVARDLQKQQPDIVHIHNFSQFVPVIRALNPKARIVLHMNCEWLTQLDRSMVEERLGETDMILGCSEYITEKIRRCFPQFAGRCHTLFNGVDLDLFASNTDGSTLGKTGAKRILFVGRVSPEKGVHVLLDAFQVLAESCPQAQLDIIGPVGAAPFEFIVPLSDDDNVSDLASFYGRVVRVGRFDRFDSVLHLEDRLSEDAARKVSFLGPIPHSRLCSHYRDSDVFAFPSVWNEPFGMPLVEAMASCVPVVATRGGGIPEIVEEGQTGLLVERANAAALAQAILYLLEDKDLRKAMGEAGQRRATRLFSWERIAEDLSQHFQTVLRSNARVG